MSTLVWYGLADRLERHMHRSLSYITNNIMVINSPATLTLQGSSTMNTGTVNGGGTLAVASSGTLGFHGNWNSNDQPDRERGRNGQLQQCSGQHHDPEI